MSLCSYPECANESKAKQLCSKHYSRLRRHGDPAFSLLAEKRCSVDGCTRTHRGTGRYCALHTVRVYRDGVPGPPQKLRASAGSGGLSTKGYRVVRGRYEHRLVMEQLLGRPLLRQEEVHHLNGDRLDNRPENLELWSKSQPSGQRVADKVAWAIELLRQYDPASLNTTH